MCRNFFWVGVVADVFGMGDGVKSQSHRTNTGIDRHRSLTGTYFTARPIGKPPSLPLDWVYIVNEDGGGGAIGKWKFSFYHLYPSSFSPFSFPILLFVLLPRSPSLFS